MTSSVPNEAPDVTLVVVSYNSERVLPGFFESLPAAIGDVDAAVVVVDNESADDSIKVALDLWPESTVVEMGRNAGYAAAINAGMEAQPPRRGLLVLNDDIRLGPGSVQVLLDVATDDGVGVAVPRLIDGNGRLLLSQRREPTVSRAFGEAILGGDRAGRTEFWGEIVHDEAAYDEVQDVAWASGCAWMIDARCWAAVGRWDESFFLYAEDLDYALRVGEAGLAIRYTPEAHAVHLVGPSHSNPRLWSMSVWNRYRAYRRRHGPIRSTLYRLALILNEVTRAAVGRSVHRAALKSLLSRSARPPEVRGP